MWSDFAVNKYMHTVAPGWILWTLKSGLSKKNAIRKFTRSLCSRHNRYLSDRLLRQIDNLGSVEVCLHGCSDNLSWPPIEYALTRYFWHSLSRSHWALCLVILEAKWYVCPCLSPFLGCSAGARRRKVWRFAGRRQFATLRHLCSWWTRQQISWAFRHGKNCEMQSRVWTELVDLSVSCHRRRVRGLKLAAAYGIKLQFLVFFLCLTN